MTVQEALYELARVMDDLFEGDRDDLAHDLERQGASEGEIQRVVADLEARQAQAHAEVLQAAEAWVRRGGATLH